MDKILQKIDKRFDSIESRLDRHDLQFEAIIKKLEEHDRRFDILTKKIADFRSEVLRGQGEIMIILKRLDKKRMFAMGTCQNLVVII